MTLPVREILQQLLANPYSIFALHGPGHYQDPPTRHFYTGQQRDSYMMTRSPEGIHNYQGCLDRVHLEVDQCRSKLRVVEQNMEYDYSSVVVASSRALEQSHARIGFEIVSGKVTRYIPALPENSDATIYCGYPDYRRSEMLGRRRLSAKSDNLSILVVTPQCCPCTR